jgi:hypothetical protein
VNALFSVKRVFIRDTEGDKKEKSTENGGLSYVVDYTFEISNLDLVRDLIEIHDFLNTTPC